MTDTAGDLTCEMSERASRDAARHVARLDMLSAGEAAIYVAAKPEALTEREVRDLLTLALRRIEDLTTRVDVLTRRSAHRDSLEGGKA